MILIDRHIKMHYTYISWLMFHGCLIFSGETSRRAKEIHCAGELLRPLAPQVFGDPIRYNPVYTMED